MTAPAVVSSVTEMTARIAAIQSMIASLSTPPSVVATAGGQFSAALATASASSGSPFASHAMGAATGVGSAGVGANGVGSTGVAGSAGITGAAVVADAKKYLGVPYVWGGESTNGIDCSGLVQSTYHDLGIDLPRIASDQANSGTAVPSLAQAQPGDLLTFGNPAYHIAIYLGNNQLIESPEPGKTVHITDVYQTPTSIRRIIPTQSTLGATLGAAGIGLSATQLSAAGMSPAVASYASQFATAEAQFKLPTGLLAAVAQQESAGNAQAVSAAGAQGLMQLMPATAAGMGVNALDPSQAIGAAAKILAGNLSQFSNSVPLALAAYNAGAGAVSRYGGIPPYAETQTYVARITAMLAAGA